MSKITIIQRDAHLASPVKLEYVHGREGKVAKALLTAISNTTRRQGEERQDQATAVQWTLWGKQAENAAAYLGKGSHVNVTGRVQDNRYTNNEGQEVYGLAFIAEELDYLDTKAEAEARNESRNDARTQRAPA